jgi:VanZ family protein
VWLAIYVVLLLTSVPLAPRLARALEGGVALATVPPLLGLVALATAARASARSWREIRVLPWVVIGALAAAVWATVCKGAVEGIHVVQYGVLSLLAVRALGRALAAWPAAYVASLALTVTVSWASEALQSMTPERVYDLRDVVLDGVSGTLGLVVAWRLDR